MLRNSFIATLLVFVLLAPRLSAQSWLYVQNGEKFSLLGKTEGSTPYVWENGQWVADTEGQYFLKPVAEYLPVLVTIEHPYYRRGARAISDNGALDATWLVHGGRFVVNLDLVAPVPLDNVSLMLAFVDAQDQNHLYLYGVGHLDAHQIRHLSIDRIIDNARLISRSRMTPHLFVGGQEVLNTLIPARKRSAALARMVEHRVAALRNADPQPLLGATPQYPAGLPQKIKGEAIISFRVDTHGRVLDPVVAKATDPAFGGAALEAIRQWRFVPKVRDGVPVESTAQIPFEFEPPA
jgi:TonB family protein